MYEEYLKNVDLLSSMDYYERVTLSDALKREKYQTGDEIIREGDPGDSFYFVIEGEAVAKKMINGVQTDVKEYEEGEYFGERALLTKEPRAATIIVTSDEMVVAKLESKSFKRLLGPVEDIMKRNMEKYAKLISDLS